MNNYSQQRIVIIGAGYAGLLAALRLNGKAKGAHITLINDALHFVERIRLHQGAAGQKLKQISIPNLLRGTNIEFVQGRVTRINVGARNVQVQQGDQSCVSSYDTLVYALGSMIDRDSVAGVRENAHVLSPSGTEVLREKLANLPVGARVIVCGGGLTGIETVTEFAESYPKLRFTLITREVVGTGLSEQGRAYLRQTFARLNIDLCEGQTVTQVEANQVITNGGEFPFDACVWSGTFAVPALAREAGINVNERGQIIVDPYLRSVSHPEIYAVGDSAFAASSEVPIRMACATAMPMASAASDNIQRSLHGEALKPFSMRYFAQCISLGRHDGMVQIVNADDTPQDKIYSGQLAVVFKEMICRYTRYSLYMERRLPGIYQFPQYKGESKRGVEVEAPRIHVVE